MVAPESDELGEWPILTVFAGQDAFVAVGSAPNASLPWGTNSSARSYVPAGGYFHMVVAPGSKVAWDPA